MSLDTVAGGAFAVRRRRVSPTTTERVVARFHCPRTSLFTAASSSEEHRHKLHRHYGIDNVMAKDVDMRKGSLTQSWMLGG